MNAPFGPTVEWIVSNHVAIYLPASVAKPAGFTASAYRAFSR
jgi:hypothetical protein